MPKMHEDASEVFIILFDTVIQRADVLLIQETQHLLLERTAALAGDDLNQFDALLNRLLHDAVQFRVDFAALVVNVVQIEFEFCHRNTLILSQTSAEKLRTEYLLNRQVEDYTHQVSLIQYRRLWY